MISFSCLCSPPFDFVYLYTRCNHALFIFHYQHELLQCFLQYTACFVNEKGPLSSNSSKPVIEMLRSKISQLQSTVRKVISKRHILQCWYFYPSSSSYSGIIWYTTFRRSYKYQGIFWYRTLRPLTMLSSIFVHKSFDESDVLLNIYQVLLICCMGHVYHATIYVHNAVRYNAVCIGFYFINATNQIRLQPCPTYFSHHILIHDETYYIYVYIWSFNHTVYLYVRDRLNNIKAYIPQFVFLVHQRQTRLLFT